MVSTALIFAAAIVGAWFLWPTSLGGCTTLTIVSGHSMEPTYYTGDLVVSRCGEPRIGDVVVYKPADLGGFRVIHRVVGGDRTAGWTVKGDNNAAPDPWRPTAVVGVAALHVAGVGRLATVLLSPLLWISLIVLALAMLLWPRRPEDVSDDLLDEAPDEVPVATPEDPLVVPAGVLP